MRPETNAARHPGRLAGDVAGGGAGEALRSGHAVRDGDGDDPGVPTRVWKNALPHLGALAALARQHGDSTFLVYGAERVSFDAWHRAVATLAAHLAELGVGKGDRVAIAMRNLPEWTVALFAATVLGAIAVPLNAWWKGDELAFALADSGAHVLIADADRWQRIVPHRADLPGLAHVLVCRAGESGTAPEGTSLLEDVIGSPDRYAALPDRPLPDAGIAPDDPATIFYTSGTTGRPKGALGTHRNLTTNILSSAFSGAQSALRRGEMPPAPQPRTILMVIPLFHVTACSATLMGSLASGSKLVLMHKWDTVEAFRLIEREKVTATGGVPFIAWQLIEHPDRAKYDLLAGSDRLWRRAVRARTGAGDLADLRRLARQRLGHDRDDGDADAPCGRGLYQPSVELRPGGRRRRYRGARRRWRDRAARGRDRRAVGARADDRGRILEPAGRDRADVRRRLGAYR
jgi:hypothetical protein